MAKPNSGRPVQLNLVKLNCQNSINSRLNPLRFRGHIWCSLPTLILVIILLGRTDNSAKAQDEFANFRDSAISIFEKEQAKENAYGNFDSIPFNSVNIEAHKSVVTWFVGLDGSKQPQDFGVNANLGVQGRLQYSAPLVEQLGIGYQLGTAVVGSGNAVQVFELLGESRERFQSFTTAGLFQRLPNGFVWGGVYDFLYQESFDDFRLSQWRILASFDLGTNSELGVETSFKGQSNRGKFNSDSVELQSIEQIHVFWRKTWQTGIETKNWLGMADSHGEENIITGGLPRKQNALVFGAEFHAPLNNWLALYGEANLIMPADTGVVDAFLGIEVSPNGRSGLNYASQYRALVPVASNPTFSTDLFRR